MVTDGVSTSKPSIVTITVKDFPTTIITGGDQPNVSVNTQATLDGRQSISPYNRPLTYSWTLGGKPSGSNAVLNSTTGQIISFTPDVVGIYFVSLTVLDGSVSDTATVTITATIKISYSHLSGFSLNCGP